MKWLTGTVVAVAVVLSIATSCKNVQQAENGVFTAEQTVCMMIGLTAGSLSGTAEVIAQDLMQACGILPALTQDVVKFVNSFQNLSPGAQAKWKAYAASKAQAAKLQDAGGQ